MSMLQESVLKIVLTGYRSNTLATDLLVSLNIAFSRAPGTYRAT